MFLLLLVRDESLMAEWLEQVSQWHEKYCHDLEVMSSNPNWVEPWVHSTSVLSRTWTPKIGMGSLKSPGAVIFLIMWELWSYIVDCLKLPKLFALWGDKVSYVNPYIPTQTPEED